MDWIRYILLFPLRFVAFLVCIPLIYLEWLTDWMAYISDMIAWECQKLALIIQYYHPDNLREFYRLQKEIELGKPRKFIIRPWRLIKETWRVNFIDTL